jgi:hypothetical protein
VSAPAVGLTPGTVVMSWLGWSLREYSVKGTGAAGHGGGDAKQLWAGPHYACASNVCVCLACLLLVCLHTT